MMSVGGRVWVTSRRTFDLTRPLIVGVVNVTPDSFSDGFADRARAVAQGLMLLDEGADLIDVGGESTRPGSEPVSAPEEIDRVIEVIAGLVAKGAAVSIDTTKAVVAAAALEAGAEVVNDVTAGSDYSLLEVVARTGAALVLMHMQGRPRDMQDNPRYDDVVGEVKAFLVARARQAMGAGVAHDHICVDPGIGFGKTLGHNLALLHSTAELAGLGYPLMIGASRKAFLGRLAGRPVPADRDLATSIVTALVVERGASLLRVHNVAACREALAVTLAIVTGSGG
jgi:dihydropteroate synthase